MIPKAGTNCMARPFSQPFDSSRPFGIPLFAGGTISVCAILFIQTTITLGFEQPTSQEQTSELRHSAIPLRSRETRELLAQSRNQIDLGAFATAAAELQTVLQAAFDHQVLLETSTDGRERYVSAKTLAGQLLYSLPSGALASHTVVMEASAQRLLQKALAKFDPDSLRDISIRFPGTMAARQALRRLSAWHLDRHDFQSARAVSSTLQNSASMRTEDRQTMDRQISQIQKLKSSSDAPPELAQQTSAESPLRARLFPIASQPRWQTDGGLDEETASLASHAFHEHFEQSIPVLPQARPLVVQNMVLTRVLNRISARDLNSGQLLWSFPPDYPNVSQERQPPSLLTMNLSLQDLLARRIAGELQLDSLHSRMTTDGKRLFTVEWSDHNTTGRTVVDPWMPDASGSPHNSVVARDLSTGEIQWTLSANQILSHLSFRSETSDVIQPSHQEDTDADSDRLGRDPVYFFSLPTVFDSYVMGLVQMGESVVLYAVNRTTGALDWTLVIGEASRGTPADSKWKTRDCRVTDIDGVLICPTGSGLLAGVDPVCRRVLWSLRSPRSDLPLEIPRLPVVSDRPIIPWWNGWRDYKVLAAESAGTGTENRRDTAIVAGPDTHGVFSIEARTGQQLWHHSVAAPIDLQSVPDGVLIARRHSIQKLDAITGSVIWEVPCREPVGTGCLRSIEDSDRKVTLWYVFPIRGGSLAAVNTSDGRTIQSVERHTSHTGCVIATENLLLIRNSQKLSVWGVNAELLPASAAGRTVERNLQTEIEQAARERQAGLVSNSAKRLRALDAAPPDRGPDSLSETERLLVRGELQKTLLAWLELRPLAPRQVETLSKELEELSRDNSLPNRIAIKHTAARSAAAAGSHQLAFRLYCELQSLNPSGEPAFSKPEVLRSVRHDRLIQGEVLDLLQECAVKERNDIHQQYERLAEAASSSPDPFALQRFARAWTCLPIAASEQLDNRSRIGLRFGQKQLALIGLSRRRDPATAFAAAKQLRELFQSRNYERDVIAVDRGLNSARTAQRITDSWSRGSVTVSEHTERNIDTSFEAVPIITRPGELFDRLNVAINQNPGARRNETRVRFYGDGISGYWETVLETSTSPLKSIGQMNQGWGIGHLLVLQLGAELFAISPFDSSGEPRAQRLWSIDMAEGNRQEDHEYLPAIPGFSPEQFTILDAFGRPVVRVGPVRASYLCYQTRSKLVCLDTATGQRLWQRFELPRSVLVTGDEESVFLIEGSTPHGRSSKVTELRTVDGATVSTSALAELNDSQSTVLQSMENRLLVARSRNAADGDNAKAQNFDRIASVNLSDGNESWSRTVKKGSFVFAAGPTKLGVVSAEGRLQLIDSQTGQEISTMTIDVPFNLATVHCSSDVNSHVLAFSTTHESLFQQQRNSGRRSLRSPKVSGLLVAVDAATGTLLWKRAVEDIRFDLDQPRNAPCLVLTYQRKRNSVSSSLQSVLHIIDRRTGEDILERRGSDASARFTLEPHADQNRFSIRMQRRSIRIQFKEADAR